MSLLQKIARAGVVFAITFTTFLPAVTPAFAWSGPLVGPPGCTSGNPGCDAPINTGPVGQTKTSTFVVSAPNGSYGIQGIGTDNPGVYGHSNTSYGIYATSNSNWGGIIQSTNGSGLAVENSVGTIYSELMTQGYGLLTNQPVNTTDVYLTSTGRWLSSISNIGFGGMFEEYAINSSCIAGNPWTGACSCPGFAPTVRWAAVGNSGNGSYAFELYYCTG